MTEGRPDRVCDCDIDTHCQLHGVRGRATKGLPPLADQATSLSALQEQSERLLKALQESHEREKGLHASISHLNQRVLPLLEGETDKVKAIQVLCKAGRDELARAEQAEAEVTALRDHLAQAQVEIAQQLEELHRYYDAAKGWEAERAALQQQLTAERAARAALVPYLWHKANCDVARSRCKCGSVLGSHHGGGGCDTFRQSACTCGLDAAIPPPADAP